MEEKLLESFESKLKGVAGSPATPSASASGGGSGKEKGDTELAQLQARLDASEKQAKQERELRLRHERNVTLRESLRTAHCADIESALDILSNRGDLKQVTTADGTIVWVGQVDDGIGGTKDAPLSDVVSDFLRKRPLFAPARGAGSGARGASGAPGGPGAPSWSGKSLSELTPEELVAMPREERTKLRNAAAGVGIGVFGGGAK